MDKDNIIFMLDATEKLTGLRISHDFLAENRFFLLFRTFQEIKKISENLLIFRDFQFFDFVRLKAVEPTN